MRSRPVSHRLALVCAVAVLSGCGFGRHADPRATPRPSGERAMSRPAPAATDGTWSIGPAADQNAPSGDGLSGNGGMSRASGSLAVESPSHGANADGSRAGYVSDASDDWTLKTDSAFSGVVFDVFINGGQIGEYAAANVSADITSFLHRGRNKVRVRWVTPPGSGGSGTLTMGARHNGHWTTLASITGGHYQVAKGDAEYLVLVP